MGLWSSPEVCKVRKYVVDTGPQWHYVISFSSYSEQPGCQDEEVLGEFELRVETSRITGPKDSGNKRTRDSKRQMPTEDPQSITCSECSAKGYQIND